MQPLYGEFIERDSPLELTFRIENTPNLHYHRHSSLRLRDVLSMPYFEYLSLKSSNYTVPCISEDAIYDP